MWNWIEWPKPPAFDKIKNFNHHDLTAKHCYLGAQGLLMLMNFALDKDDQATKHCSFILNVLRPGHFYQTSWSHQHQETLSTRNNNVCIEVMMIKIFNPIQSRRPWPPNSISHLFQQGLFSSWPLLFYTWGVLV